MEHITGRDDSQRTVEIVGGGPTGLSAALFLAERNMRPHVIETRPKPPKHSKAFGINARTLELLQHTGVTETLLAEGLRLQGFNLHRKGRVLGRLDFAAVRHRFPFMLILSQARTEAILEQALQRQGVIVERGSELVGLSIDAGNMASLRIRSNAGEHSVTASRVFGADGSHSRVRQALGIKFEGRAYEEPWKIYDVELDSLLARDEAHAFMLDDGAAFAVRIEGEVWRVLGNVPNLLSRLPPGTRTGRVVWETDFGIAHRLAARFAAGPAFLAGDAAHIHSGLGARGMNLGIEDAFVFATLAAENRLADYERLRRPVVSKVMDTIERLTEVPRGVSTRARMARKLAPLIPFVFPLLRRFAQPWILGLDHPVRTR